MMAGAVKMLVVGGIRAETPQLGRLKNPLLRRTVSDRSNYVASRTLSPC
jgi:hypothetical protein